MMYVSDIYRSGLLENEYLLTQNISRREWARQLQMPIHISELWRLKSRESIPSTGRVALEQGSARHEECNDVRI